MSTSRTQAEYDLSTQLPSCSHQYGYSESDDDAIYRDVPLLCQDVMIEIFRKVARTSGIQQQLVLKKVSRLAEHVVAKEMEKNEELKVEIKEPSQYRITGFKRELLAQPEPNIIVQGSHVNSISEAIFLVRQAVQAMKCLKKLIIFCADSDLTHFEMILDEVLGKENVQLEMMQLRRRRGGASVKKVVQLVKENASTLKRVGQIGLGEAAECLIEPMELDRLSVNSFDLGFDTDPDHQTSILLKIADSGTTARHLSYSSFIGFDPTDDVVQRFLTCLEVKSLRLTMMCGPYLMPQPDYMIGKVRQIEHVEMVEVVEKTNIFNSLVTYEKAFKKVFPNVEDINYGQDWIK